MAARDSDWRVALLSTVLVNAAFNLCSAIAMADADPLPLLQLPANANTIFPGIPAPPPITTAVPSDEDIVRAVEFKTLVSAARCHPENPTSIEAVATAAKWQHQVLTAAVPAAAPEGGPPPWMQALFDGLGAKIESLQTDVRKSHKLIVKFAITYSKRNNGLLSDPSHLDEVPFPDGTMPWGETVKGPQNIEVVLPALSSVQAVVNLDTPQSYGYFKGYFPDIPQLPPVVQRRKKILQAIGRLESEMV